MIKRNSLGNPQKNPLTQRTNKQQYKLFLCFKKYFLLFDTYGKGNHAKCQKDTGHEYCHISDGHYISLISDNDEKYTVVTT